jgi:sterol 3beta-glucosyltransferase
MEEDYQPPRELKDFLSAGKTPVCVTFGSMLNRESERITYRAMAAIQKTNHRAIFLTGWNGFRPERIPDNMLFMEAVPHHWLFPLCKMVIHHGGAGTTGAGLHAGVPNIIVPHTADQPFWGMRVHAIGVGPKPIPVRRLSTERLAAAIIEAEGDAIRRRAQAIGQEMRSEDGVRKAVELIEKVKQTS